MTILFLSALMLTTSYEEINTLFHQVVLQTAEVLMLKNLKMAFWLFYLCLDICQHQNLSLFKFNLIK